VEGYGKWVDGGTSQQRESRQTGKQGDSSRELRLEDLGDSGPGQDSHYWSSCFPGPGEQSGQSVGVEQYGSASW
jgi:hypothetical protein